MPVCVQIAKSRALQQPMIRNRRRGSGSVGVASNERDVLAFTHQVEAEKRQRSQHTLLGSVDWELSQEEDSGQNRFSQKGLKHRRVGLE